MSLAINVDKVTAVLLSDGWHKVMAFDLDAYEYVEYYDKGKSRAIFGGGQCRLISSTGFTFTDQNEQQFAGPLTSILAVQYDQ